MDLRLKGGKCNRSDTGEPMESVVKRSKEKWTMEYPLEGLKGSVYPALMMQLDMAVIGRFPGNVDIVGVTLLHTCHGDADEPGPF